MAKRNKKERQTTTIFLVSSVILVGLSFLPLYSINWKFWDKSSDQTQSAKIEQIKNQIFGKLEIEAKSFVVWDPAIDSVIYGQKAEERRPLASLTKVMTALTASELALGRPNLVITVDDIALATSGDNGLLKDEKWPLDKLIDLTLVSSSNDGAEAIARSMAQTASVNFVAEMNQRAKDIGLNQTLFRNETGLDVEAGEAGAYGSAADVARMFSYILKNYPDLLAATRQKSIAETSLDDYTHIVSNTNEIVGQIPGLLASKTGYTDAAGGNLAVAATVGLNRSVVFVVLGSSQNGRFSDTKKLVKAAEDYFAAIGG